MSSEITLQQIAENITKSILNANDKDIEGFQKILEESIKLRESHRSLQKLVKDYSTSNFIRAKSS
ncbi:hypothetical protein EKG37_19000 [Robertmurraya yapensis]|uniref:Uncharacterized protein n=2 Tax=Bacillaceae TaxID=186817 RepID=A0A3S0JRU0_9BACI|nr:hypothetical protein [Bacillus yapensis]RTR27607.1 hypothetical protein EKG37_19000 [Bacillus yapensis]TKS94174.1 hypothetical protein FAR12_19010 [Bacillus yapensis]